MVCLIGYLITKIGYSKKQVITARDKWLLIQVIGYLIRTSSRQTGSNGRGGWLPDRGKWPPAGDK